MEHQHSVGKAIEIVPEGNFNYSFISVTNILSQLEWKTIALTLLASILVTVIKSVDGHGRLFDPPSRSTAWRVGFDTPKDYNDMEGFCGGFDRQWLVNQGRCGVCGDPFDELIKPHEAPGGIFATGTIVRNYTQGQIIPVSIQITATHRGFYEFRLCPNNNPLRDPSQECFEKFPLKFVDDNGATSGVFSLENLTPATYQVKLKLPPDVTCKQCIIQTYVTGNRWGLCSDGTSRLGCGPQESFRACSDVAISPIEWYSPDSLASTTTLSPQESILSTSSHDIHSVESTTIEPTASTFVTNAPFSVKPTFTTTVRLPTKRPTTAPLPTKRPTTVRPNRPLRPSRPTRPPRPTKPSKPITIPTTTKIPFTLSSALPSTTTKPPQTSRPSSIDNQQATVNPGGGNGECTNYIPVVSNIPGMDTWCKNNCRLGYCPRDFCKCVSLSLFQ